MKYIMWLMLGSLIIWVVITGIERNKQTNNIEDECVKTDMMVDSYRDGWRHVYDCSGKDI